MTVYSYFDKMIVEIQFLTWIFWLMLMTSVLKGIGMTFTTPLFLLGLLPVFIIMYYALKNNRGIRFAFLSLVNVVFYIWGGLEGFFVLIVMCTLTWYFSNVCYRCKNRYVFGIFCFILLAPLLLIKYLRYIFDSINLLWPNRLMSLEIIVPIGMSFITFNAISCLVDVYTHKQNEKIRFRDVFLYLSFFPTVVSGPLMRIGKFKDSLVTKLSVDKLNSGILQFVKGLSKKVLLADKVAILADYYFNGVANGNNYSVLGLWIGSISYTLQLYFDFSGYSDMAIGLARVLGVEVSKNFNKPYQARSMQEFWRRWHISLSMWFKDYVYIPLGGNRCDKKIKNIRNLFVVWVLTGIWHGADLTFIVWAMGHLGLLMLEKYVLSGCKMFEKWYGTIYTLFWVNLLWIPFRTQSLSVAVKYGLGMMGVNVTDVWIESKAVQFMPILLLCIILCMPLDKVINKYKENIWYKTSRAILYLLLVVLSTSVVINSTYSPYIYGNF